MSGYQLDIKDILKRLPHRYPFLLVDRIINLDLDNNKIVALKSVSMNEQFFQGHFPGEPIMPGVLILEALAQTGGILMFEKGFQQIKVLTTIRQARFRRTVRPGDSLILEVEASHLSKRGGKVQGVAKVDGKVTTEAEIVFGLLTTNEPQEVV
ncbi:MAG: 3-hydroxyacyl-ACP dehydratase FabZ [Chlamydiae bacterium]|nr:3-hydroxyacyl-ACP dehydratase FabZ [Chlamydiota bacterium]